MPKDRLLEFRQGYGYRELCDFLGEPLPGDEPYPRINQTDNIIKMQKKLYWSTVATAVAKFGGVLGATAVTADVI